MTEPFIPPMRRGGLMHPDTDILLREVASEIGTTVEQAVGLAVDRGQDLALCAIMRIVASRQPGPRQRSLLLQAARPLRTSSFLVPPAAGRVAAATSYVAMRVGLGLLGHSRDALLRMRMRGIVPRRGM
jgi:hypothetical protein